MSGPDGRSRIAIVGGGLSGLTAAFLLQQQGVHDVVLLEARSQLGGRVLSIDPSGAVADAAVAALDRFDLGPSWFWPSLQPQLAALIEHLGLESFAQYEAGDTVVERSPHEAPQRFRGFANEPPSMRLLGGTGALVTALQSRLAPNTARTGHSVRTLQSVPEGVLLQLASPSGEAISWQADHVLLALPPRLAEGRLAFDPSLPPQWARSWRQTPTWMAPHAKYVAVYPRPFWREQGLSGAARSGHGPMGEIHDISMPGGHAALFGFLGIGARARQQAPEAVLRAHCRAQLGRLFGAAAATPLADALKDWAADPLTATDADQDPSGQHAAAPPSQADQGPWQGRLTGIASEWSPQFPGYLAGAVDAAARGVAGCLTRSRA
jgi:monoamine oxidase